MINLNDREWKKFKLGQLFTIYTGGDLIMSRVKNGCIPIVSHSMSNNGISAWTSYIEGQKLFNYNKTISLADRGNFCALVQSLDFYIATRVKALEIISDCCSKTALIFICTLINAQSVKFSYGNNCCDSTDILNILLPIDDNCNPDYQFMEDYVIQKEKAQKATYNKYAREILSKIRYTDIPSLNEKEWKEFLIEDIFYISSGKRLTKSDMINGMRPFIGASDSNNGITNFVNNINSSLDKNVLGVNYNGSVVENFYHPYECIFSDDVKRFSLKEKQGNVNIYLFLKTIILQQKVKYAYGYKFNGARMKKQILLIPVDISGNPDYEYMEQYSMNIISKQLYEYLP